MAGITSHRPNVVWLVDLQKAKVREIRKLGRVRMFLALIAMQLGLGCGEASQAYPALNFIKRGGRGQVLKTVL